MTFAVGGAAYDRYMGRYSRRLSPRLADFAGIAGSMSALDVGCGPGSLTEELVRRLGGGAVAAIDPSEPLVEACAQRVPGADVRVGAAERLPWPDESFDAVVSQLVVNFMDDAEAGVGEMRRVARRGGVVASCTWDYGNGMRMLRTFWDAALALDPEAPDEGRVMPFQDPDSLAELWTRVGLHEVTTDALVVEAVYEDFDDYWQPFTIGTAPGGAYCASLDPARQEALREECRRRLGDPRDRFPLSARAWAVRGRA